MWRFFKILNFFDKDTNSQHFELKKQLCVMPCLFSNESEICSRNFEIWFYQTERIILGVSPFKLPFIFNRIQIYMRSNKYKFHLTCVPNSNQAYRQCCVEIFCKNTNFVTKIDFFKESFYLPIRIQTVTWKIVSPVAFLSSSQFACRWCWKNIEIYFGKLFFFFK